MADNTIVHPKCESRSHLINLFAFRGAPVNNDAAPDRRVEILVNEGYVSGYCPGRMQPLWVAYRVAGHDRDVDYDRPHLYYDDERLGSGDRAGPQTFGRTAVGIQLNVGHMAPNEVINRQFGRLAQMETFFMSNMSPQWGSLNSGAWLNLENKIRNIEDTSGKDHVWAMVGPIFDDDPELIDRPNGTQVPIPASYYCILADPFRWPYNTPSTVDVAYFILPQDAERETPLDEFESDRATIESATNLSFFPQWPAPAAPPSPGPHAPASAQPGGLSPSRQESAQRHRLLRQLHL